MRNWPPIWVAYFEHFPPITSSLPHPQDEKDITYVWIKGYPRGARPCSRNPVRARGSPVRSVLHRQSRALSDPLFCALPLGPKDRFSSRLPSLAFPCDFGQKGCARARRRGRRLQRTFRSRFPGEPNSSRSCGLPTFEPSASGEWVSLPLSLLLHSFVPFCYYCVPRRDRCAPPPPPLPPT